MPKDTNQYYCEKCHKTMAADNFYTSNNLEKYPEGGKLHQCKKCITMHIDNWNPDTYLWILQELDVPYSVYAWDNLLDTYGKDKSKLTGLSILGRYLSKMKLKQYKDYRWADTQFVQEQEQYKIEQAMKRSGCTPQQIAETAKMAVYENAPAPPQPEVEKPQDTSTFGQEIEDSLISDLTDEDRKYLCIKWGKSYRPDEWVRLEELYQQMLQSYDIQSAGDINTLKLACKSSLKANQLLDIGDIEGAQKASKMYNDYMKAGKWTAAQNKTEENEGIDSIGELVRICEMDGFIPKYYADGPQDKADRLLQDLERYTANLVTNESNLTTMMERAVVQMNEEEARIAAAAKKGDEDNENEMFDYDKPAFEEADYSEFKDFQEEQLAESDK